jgi:hypothetical protein
MYLCYIDESGTIDIPGSTSHYVLAGLSFPYSNWKNQDKEIEQIKGKYDLQDTELHTGWMLGRYKEEPAIPNFVNLSFAQRRSKVRQLRKAELLKLQKTGGSAYRQVKKNFAHTDGYIHLTYQERVQFVMEIATCVSRWGNARLFAECVDKVFFDPVRTGKTVAEQSFEQVVTRFEHYLQVIGANDPIPELCYGLLIHDNNETIAKRCTALMKDYHKKGTSYLSLERTVETPLFVDSQLTSMVQIVDLCAYGLRRYLENGEENIFNLVMRRADRKQGVLVGVRHYTDSSCTCKICSAHRILPAVIQAGLPMPTEQQNPNLQT